MGRIDRQTRPELPESADWMRIGKITGGVAAGALLLWVAYVQTQRRDVPVVGYKMQSRIIGPGVPRSSTAPPVPSSVPVSQSVANAEPKVTEHLGDIEASAPTFAAAPPPPVAPAAEPTPVKAKSLRERMDSCIVLRGETQGPPISSLQPMGVTSGVNVLVSAANTCREEFPGNDHWFKIYAVSGNGSYLGSEVGRFQTTIPANGSLSTNIFVPCDPTMVTHFDFKPWP